MKRAAAFLCAVVILLGLCLMAGCGAKNDTVTPDETLRVRQMLEERDYGTENLQVYVLYNSLNRPAYLLCISDDANLICRRRDFKFCESVRGSSAYQDYLDVKKYYSPPLCYVIRAEDVIGSEEEPDGKYYYLMSEKYGSFHPGLFHPVVYLPLLALLAAVIITVTVRKRKRAARE